MLYDQNQGIRAKLLALRAWVAKRNPNESYDWRDAFDCLFCQYHDCCWTNVPINDYGSTWPRPTILSPGLSVAHYIGAGDGSITCWTFGKAIKRIDECLDALTA